MAQYALSCLTSEETGGREGKGLREDGRVEEGEGKQGKGDVRVVEGEGKEGKGDGRVVEGKGKGTERWEATGHERRE